MIGKPLVSLVIGTKNMATTVGDAIESIMNQDYSNKEIIVINDGSTDNTEEILKKYPIRIINIKNQGISNARNLGFKMANGSFIAFTDADCELEPSWISNVLNNFNDKDVGLVGAQIIFKKDNSYCSILRNLEFSKRLKNGNEHKVVWVGGQGLMFRRSVLEEIGGFSPYWYHGEDTEISFLTTELGYKVILESNAITYHVPENGFWRLVKKRYRDSKAHMRVFKSHPKNYFNCKFINSWYFPYDMILLPILYAFLLLSAIILPILSVLIYFLEMSTLKILLNNLFFPIWISFIAIVGIFLFIYSLIPAIQVRNNSKNNPIKNFFGTLLLHHVRGFSMGLALILGIKNIIFKKHRSKM